MIILLQLPDCLLNLNLLILELILFIVLLLSLLLQLVLHVINLRLVFLDELNEVIQLLLQLGSLDREALVCTLSLVLD